MAELEEEEFAFIKEKIKQKPVNKKRLFKQGVFTLVLAVLFGLVSCFVFVFMYPVLEDFIHPQEDSLIKIPEDELSTEELLETQEPETETEPIAPEPETEQAPVIVKELELSDYQMLQNKIYAIGKEANCSVVTVTGVVSDTDWFNNSYESNGQASGIIIGDNGSELLILTEHKMVMAAEQIHVTFIDEFTVNAFLKKYDGNTGIAILSVALNEVSESTKSKIAYATLGNSLTVEQGNVFTTDIAGNSNSSGVLLNLNGEIVGLVMQEYSENGDNSTLTAISISELKKIIEMLSYGMDIPYLGLKIVTVTDKIAADYDLVRGVYIKEVMLDSPAFNAGLQNGDVIIEMGGEEIYSIEAYESKVLELKPGAAIEIVVSRQGMDEYLRLTCNVTAGQLW